MNGNALAAATGMAALALSGCGSGRGATRPGQTDSATSTARATACARRSGFELSLVSDRGGQATPVRAADWFAAHGGIRGVPRTGWRLTGRNHGGAMLASGQTVLHAIRGSDGTWQVDSGYTCTSS